MHIDRNPYTRMRIEQLLVCCIIVVCCHCCADYNKHYLIRSVTTGCFVPFQEQALCTSVLCRASAQEYTVY